MPGVGRGSCPTHPHLQECPEPWDRRDRELLEVTLKHPLVRTGGADGAAQPGGEIAKITSNKILLLHLKVQDLQNNPSKRSRSHSFVKSQIKGRGCQLLRGKKTPGKCGLSFQEDHFVTGIKSSSVSKESCPAHSLLTTEQHTKSLISTQNSINLIKPTSPHTWTPLFMHRSLLSCSQSPLKC